MRFRGTLYHGADECWTMDSDDALLPVLMASNAAMAKERRGRNGPCDGGEVFRDGKKLYTLVNEHWVHAST